MLADQPHQVAGDAPPVGGSPCYIGGWSACAHWGLTEQVFRTLLVVTARRVRHRDVEIQGLPLHLTVRASGVMTQHAGPARIGSEQGGQDPDRGGLAGGIGLLRQQAVLCSAPGYLSTAAF
jgi:hypothetical protein